VRAAAVAIAALLVVAPGCRRAILTPVPEPLPEALPWTNGGSDGAFLGLRTRENDSGSLEDLFFRPGVRVVGVIENSPSDHAGIRVGDVLLSGDGRRFDDPGALDAWVAAQEPGARARLEVQRDDTVFGVEVELTARVGGVPEPEVLYRLDPTRSGAGWATDRGGVRLVSAAGDSPVVDAGIPIGSLVTALDAEAVGSDRELVRRLLAHDPGCDVTFDFVGPDGSKGREEVELIEPATYLAGFHVPIVVHYDHDPERNTTAFSFLDLWFISLLEFRRDGKEKTWTFLKCFSYSSGIGELAAR
jgi:membrane-associated protease RseP (regulator of RpoE activity)